MSLFPCHIFVEVQSWKNLEKKEVDLNMSFLETVFEIEKKICNFPTYLYRNDDIKNEFKQ